MRIITGSLKGRVIPGPKSDNIRPTSDRTKESMFGIIDARKGFNEEDEVLDLFAGTGNLGFEAISRGAKKVIAVEKDAKAVRSIINLAEKFNVSDKVTTFAMPVENFLRNNQGRYDLIFADPPYDWEGLEELPEIILSNGFLKVDGWFLLEHDRRFDFSMHPHCVFSKKYGRTIVTIFLSFPVIDEEQEDMEN